MKHTRPTMHLAIVSLWLLLTGYWWGPSMRMILTPATAPARAAVAAVIAWLMLSAYYACFHLMSVLFSICARRRAPERATTPPVAILYPCMNDMQEAALLACVAQDYPDFAVFVLDDSTSKEEQDRVDAVGLTVLRRPDRRGFKAGNLNHALRSIGDAYDYVCVLDADEVIPSTFLRDMVSIAEADPELGFVQCAHRLYGATEYGKKTGDGIAPHWNYFLPARNSFGFVYSYGHGVLFRADALAAAGGFPEVISEDLAVSTELRRAGYRGHYTRDVESREETPSSYRAFRRRQGRIIAGTLEFLARYALPFLRAPRVSVVEKMDLLVTLAVIYLPIPFLGFLLVLHALLPGGRTLFAPFATPSGIAFIALTAFAPLCYLMPSALRSPRRTAAYVMRMGTIHLSLCVHTLRVAVQWLMTKRTSFVPTGDRSRRDSMTGGDIVESLLGVALLGAGVALGSPCLMAVGLSLALVPTLLRSNLDNRLVGALAMAPLVLAVAAIVGMPLLFLGVTGAFAGVALAHY